MPDYLRGLAEKARMTRESAISRLTSKDAVRARQAWVRETFWRLTGGMPDRTPLNTRKVGAFERPGYSVEKIIYESFAGLHIPANLYVPKVGKPPYPGVLFQMGHSLNGKAADPYQRCCQGLVRLGYVVLAFDPMGQGERVYYPDASGKRTRLPSADDEHTVPGRQMILKGYTCTRLQVWDAVRSLDYLASHPLVDPKRLASTGQSGGGTLTMLLAAVDDRLACAAVSAGNTENFACLDFNPPGSTDDAEQNLLNAGPAGFDRWDLLYPMAPKPLWIGVSAKDFFGTYSPSYIVNGREEYAKLERVYRLMGAGEKIAWSESPLPHGLSYDSRVEIYNWFERWLKGSPRRIEEEPPVQPEPDETLSVTKSGNVKELGGETPFSLSRAAKPRAMPMEEREPLSGPFSVLKRVASRHCEIEAVEVASDEKVWIPAWLFLPKQERRDRPVLLLAEPSGRNVRWREGDLYQELAADGFIVCAPDIRGVGDLVPEVGRGAVRYTKPHNDEEHWAWASLMLGDPLAKQRARDLVSVASALRSRFPAPRLVLAALGKMAVPAILAQRMEKSIDKLYLAGGLKSFQEIVDREDYAEPFASFLPGVLAEGDLTSELMAPREAWSLETFRSL